MKHIWSMTAVESPILVSQFAQRFNFNLVEAAAVAGAPGSWRSSFDDAHAGGSRVTWCASGLDA